MAARLVLAMRVQSRRLLAPDVVELVFRHRSGRPLQSWQPGAHVDLHLPDGRIRQYSLCGTPADGQSWRIAVKRVDAGRGGSQWIHDHLLAGSDAWVSAPRQAFRLPAQARRVLLVAGGIGITPIKPMAEELARRDADFVLHYCVRTRRDAVYAEELARHCGARLVLHVSDEGSRIDDYASLLAPFAADGCVCCCGPAGLMEAVADGARAVCLAPERLRVEHFSAAADETLVPEPFQVRFTSSSAVLEVGADESLLVALHRAGHVVPAVCQSGVCGTCECPYVSGAVLHRDRCLEPEQRERSLTACVSRATGTLLLDL